MIKAVIFDFGNVLYDLNYELFYANFSALLDRKLVDGLPEPLDRAVLEYETGSISTENFIWKFQHFMKGQIDPLDIINCWNSLLDEFPFHRWAFLEKLAEKHKLYLLSNINELHLSTIYKNFVKSQGKVDFETRYFTAVFYSHMIGLSKPNIDLYKYVEEGLNLKGEEIFFVDDRSENVEAARKRGWKAVQHDPSKEIATEFDHYFNPYR